MPYSSEQIAMMCKKAGKLRSDRGNWEVHWQEIAQVMHPFNDQFNIESSEGETKLHFIYDATGIHANQLLSSGLFSLLTNPVQEWFSWRMTNAALNEIYDVLEWLDEVSRITFHEINKPEANFNNAVHECYMEFGAFGTCVMYVTEQIEKQALLFQSLPLSQCFIQENDAGIVDVLYRKYKRTVRQLVQRFGYERVHKHIQERWDSARYDEKIDCIHLIEPNNFKPKVSNFPIVSIYLDLQHKHIMQAKGFYEFPVQAPRFTKTGYETYGRGPGSIALPDVKMLQEIMRTFLRAAQKAVDPPLMVPDNGFLNPIRTTPGGLNYYRSGTGERIEALDFGSDPKLGHDVIRDVRTRIQEIFFIDQLQLQEGPQMTATEVLQRTEEKLRLMGPMMGRLQTEFLGPMLNRVFNLLQRAGKYPPPPEIISGQNFRVIYTSPIARAQEQTEANGIMRATQLLTPYIEMNPEILDIVNGDELARGVFNMYSVSPKYLNKDSVIQAKRQERARQQERQMMAELLNKGGAGMKNMAEAQQIGGEIP